MCKCVASEEDNPIWAQHELGMTLSRAADFLVETKIGICRFFAWFPSSYLWVTQGEHVTDSVRGEAQ